MADPSAVDEKIEPDPHFEPTERLYRRVWLEEVVNRTVSDAALPSPAFSVNREKYAASPADMLRDHPGMTLAVFQVKDIPTSLRSDGGELFEFGVEHRPEDGNYAHSEVHSYKDGVRLADLDKSKPPPPHLRKKFRDLLRQKIEILDLGGGA